MTEFNLSDKAIITSIPCPQRIEGCLVLHQKYTFNYGDVREFIKLLKEEFGSKIGYEVVHLVLKRLAGDKLI